MAITTKKIHEIVKELSGEEGVKIVEFLKGKKNISEFTIADKTKLDMQTTRNILYKLNGHNICVYIRKKDRKKGWYISYWTFNRAMIKDMIEKLRRERMDRLTEQLKKEESNKDNFYICSRACARLDFDQATEFEFKCPECGNLLNLQENSKTIENIKEKIKELSSAS
jgi:transcription initiation factor TFIIE subunit alpha|tara:strand:+ start:86 stop:589 length:504 start_codon:yes stop_codon:yes gene_type:complete